MKICKKCSINKDLSNFSKCKSNKDGLNNWCKDCNKIYLKNHYLKNKDLYSNRSKENYKLNSEKVKEKSKNWRIENKEYTKEYFKKYYLENKDILSEYKKEHYSNNKDKYLSKSKKQREDKPEEYSEYLKRWRFENPEYNKNYLKKWFEDNPEKRRTYFENFKTSKPHIIAWRRVLQNTLSRIGAKKSNSTIEMLGYSANDLKTHLENLFMENMSWENYGEWHIDHKIPVSKFDKETPMNIVNGLDNLQPLWAFDNLSKGNKIID
jgi:hypothetical protein